MARKERQPTTPLPSLLRRLESRRVLDASLASLLLPATAVEGETVVASDLPSHVTYQGALNFDWTVTQDGQVVLQSTSPTFDFTPADNGVYDIELTLNGSSTSTTLSVINVAPTLSNVSITPTLEGNSATLTGDIADPGVNDTFELKVDWGDGTSDTYSYAAGTTDFSETHLYVDDNPTATSADFPEVKLTLTDNGGGQDDFSLNATVLNVAPQLQELAATDSNENGTTTLTGKIVDPDSQDTFLLSVDWGDGTFDEYNYTTGTTEFSETHQYLDDNPTGTPSDTPTITVLLVDDDNGSDLQFVSPTVTNVAPQLQNLAATSVNENSSTTLTGEIIDPGTLDTFIVTVDWGDGTSDSYNYAAGTTTFSETHQYLDDNPTGTQTDTATITVKIVDDDTGSDEQQLSIQVLNVAPKLQDLAATDVDENGTTTLTGKIVDPGSQDTFLLSVDWGDGTFDEYNYAAGTTEFSETHQYLDDNPTGTPSDTPTITILLVDDDNGSHLQFVSPTVTNVAPEIGTTPDVTVNEGERFELVNGMTTGIGFTDVGTQDTHTATVDWGDGTPVETLTVTFVDGVGRLDGGHTYADNGTYTATITVTDDDTGTVEQSFSVNVLNVDPILTGTDDLVVNEGEGFTLAGLGVGVSDPGFDNPLNTGDATNGSEVEETFTAGIIDWGDGSAVIPVSFVSRVSGSVGVLTTAELDHATHHYADNGTYTVEVTFADDDGAMVTRSFTITVNNVAPTLDLIDPNATLNEGDTLTLPTLGTFSDPGFNNPLNPGGATTESFSYSIDWGDGTVETGQLPSLVTQGSAGVLTTGSLAAEHVYADNDVDNLYTVSVTLVDDDGGSVTKSFDVTVLNVAPTLDPITATDLEGEGITTLELTFSDPGADSFEVLVDWGDKLHLPPADRFVVETIHVGPTPQSFSIDHQYTGPPDPQHPAADILITVKIRDDDFATATTLVVGESNLESVTITNSGIEDNKVAIDTTPQAPAIEFPDAPEVIFAVETTESGEQNSDSGEIGAAAADQSAVSDRFLEIRVVAPDGTEGEGLRLEENALDDLPGLFSRLPDNHYRIYLIQEETNSERLVIDVNARGGRLIDPSDDSDGGRDRPPTAEEPAVEPATEEAVTEESALNTVGVIQETTDEASKTTASSASISSASVAALAVVGSKKASRRQIEQALVSADQGRWQRLFRQRRH